MPDHRADTLGRSLASAAVPAAALAALVQALIASAAGAQQMPAGAAPVRPGFQAMRFDEDWRPLASPELRTAPLDALKWIPIGPDVFATLGGELRLRAEVYDDIDLGLNGAGANDYLLTRVMLHGDVHVGETLRGFVQLRIGSVLGATPPLATSQDNALDINQAFVDLVIPAGTGRLTLRLGRQELAFGSGRFIAPREGPNVRQSFDGARGSWSDPEFGRIDVFYTQPVVARRGAFDDGGSDAYRFWGVYAALPFGVADDRGIDAYYLRAERARVVFGQGAGAERRNTLGLRVHGRRGNWDWDIEAAYQYGRFGAAEIRAYTFANEIGYRARGLAWTPRLGVRLDLASGDGDLGDDRLETLEVPFPRLPYLGEPNFVAPANIIDLHPSLTLNPRRNVRLGLEYIAVWKHRAADALYLPPLRPIAVEGESGRFIQQIAQAGARWQVTPQAAIELIYARSFVGGAVRAAGGSDSDFLSLTATARF